MTDRESEEFDEDHIGLDGGEGGEKDTLFECFSDDKMEQSSDEGALNVDGHKFNLE